MESSPRRIERARQALARNKGVDPDDLKYIGDQEGYGGKLGTHLFNIMDPSHPNYKSTIAWPMSKTIETTQGEIMSIWTEVEARGIPYDHHESDLYIPVNDETRELLQRSGHSHTAFFSSKDHKMWFDIPFAYEPWWEKRTGNRMRGNPRGTMTEFEAGDEVGRRHREKFGRGFSGDVLFKRAVRRELKNRSGIEPIKAIYDRAGNCTICGEAGRCPGWHIQDEVYGVRENPWKGRVRDTYSTLEELEAYDETYGIVKRLGYRSAKRLWDANPVIGGSVHPEDLRVMRKDERLPRRGTHLPPARRNPNDDYPEKTEPDDEDIAINDSEREAFYAGKLIVETREVDWDELSRQIVAWMNRNKYWPDVWRQDDHGGWNLVTADVHRYAKFPPMKRWDRRIKRYVRGNLEEVSSNPMKLMTKEIERKARAQYAKGAELEGQMIVAKFFDPQGSWSYYLMNQDPEDPDYLYGIVSGFEVEMGSFSLSELQNFRGRFGLGFERDLHFRPISAKEVWDRLNAGEHI